MIAASSVATLALQLLEREPVALLTKVTGVLAIAAACAMLLRRSSASVRHFIWLIAIVTCAAMLLLTPIAPAVRVAIAPTTDASARDVSPISASENAHRSAVSRETLAPIATALAPAPTVVSDRPRVERNRVADARAWLAANGVAVALAMWILGTILVLVRCAIGHVAVARLRARSTVLASSDWRFSIQVAARAVGLRRPVVVAVSDTLSAPITFGVRHPIVLLPADAHAWTVERRDVVLVHELAHVARGDYATQLIATVTLAMFWFHPLVWLAAARLRLEAEQAADDRVLSSGTTGVAYATHLLEIASGTIPSARSSLPVTAGVAVGMIRTSRLEGRFRAMLDARRSRHTISRRLSILTTSLSVAIVVPLAGTRAVRRADLPVAPSAPTTTRAAGQPGAFTTTASFPATAAGSALAPMPQGPDSILEKTIDMQPGGRLAIDLRTGASLLLHGWDQPSVRLRAIMAGRDWRDATVTLEPTAAGADLRSRFMSGTSGSTSLRFELWVPRHTSVNLASAGGSLEIDDVHGDFVGHTGGGTLSIHGASGHASLTTGGGAITVLDSDLSGTVSTGGGTIDVRNVSGGLRAYPAGAVMTDIDDSMQGTVRGSIGTTSGGRTIDGSAYSYSTSNSYSSGVTRTVSTTTVGLGTGIGFGQGTGPCNSQQSWQGAPVISGSATTRGSTTTVSGAATYVIGSGTNAPRISGVTGGAFAIAKPGGTIEVESAPGGANLSTGGGRIYVGSSNGQVIAGTGGGDVELRGVAGNALVSTGAGDVTITLVNADGTQHSIDVCDGHGPVVIEVPSNLDARFELETAYTDNFGRKTVIDSDIPLAETETSTWDDRFGTPRRFVRATGQVGSGAGLIRVSTVNGDVVIRRR